MVFLDLIKVMSFHKVLVLVSTCICISVFVRVHFVQDPSQRYCVYKSLNIQSSSGIPTNQRLASQAYLQ
jgi:hypothetical protein